MAEIKAIFCDVGGVLLTNGWDHHCRIKAAKTFNFDASEFEARHQLMFYDYETGRISLDNYLFHTLFFQPRAFTKEAFIEFMYEQSEPYPEMLDFIAKLKSQSGLKVVLLSNEGRELTLERIKRFHLSSLADFFLFSCFIGRRKPDPTVFRMAIDFVQLPPQQIAYLDDRPLLVEIASEMGIKAICHKDFASTYALLKPHLR